MSRQQKAAEPMPGVRVTGWSPHRYTPGSSEVTPADVNLAFWRYGSLADNCGPLIDVTAALTPQQARALAAALVSAAEFAETAALTKEHEGDAVGATP